MRALLILWITPLVLFWGWYYLSFYDLNFGYVLLSRRLHDLVFELYAEMLGIDAATIPPMLARACILDSFLVAGIVAFRWRRAILARLGALRGRYLPQAPAPGEDPARSA